MNQLFQVNLINKGFPNMNNINYQQLQKINYRQIKEFYKTKSNLCKFLKNKNCSQFLENFELIEYINSGASGVVYKGCSNKNPNNTQTISDCCKGKLKTAYGYKWKYK